MSSNLNKEDLENLSLKELKAIAKSVGLTNYSNYKSADKKLLINKILKTQSGSKSGSKSGSNVEEKKAVKPDLEKKLSLMKVVDLNILARESGITGYSKLKKNELIEVLVKNEKVIKKLGAAVSPPPPQPEEESESEEEEEKAPKVLVSGKGLITVSETVSSKMRELLKNLLENRKNKDVVATITDKINELDETFYNDILTELSTKKLYTGIEEFLKGNYSDYLSFFIAVKTEQPPKPPQISIPSPTIPRPSVIPSPKPQAQGLNRDSLKKQTVKEMQEMMKNRQITTGVGKLKKDEIIDVLLSSKCEPDQGLYCKEEEICDTRNKICINKNSPLAKGNIIHKIGDKYIIGSTKTIDYLKQLLGEAPAPVPAPAKGKYCNPYEEKHCDGDEVCDIDRKICLKIVEINGRKFIGSDESLKELVSKLAKPIVLPLPTTETEEPVPFDLPIESKNEQVISPPPSPPRFKPGVVVKPPPPPPPPFRPIIQPTFRKEGPGPASATPQTEVSETKKPETKESTRRFFGKKDSERKESGKPAIELMPSMEQQDIEDVLNSLQGTNKPKNPKELDNINKAILKCLQLI